MTESAITFARSARKEFGEAPIQCRERILDKITALAVQPRPSGCVKLKGQKDIWRIRIGDYRIVYTIDDLARLVDISVIRHRRDVYRDF